MTFVIIGIRLSQMDRFLIRVALYSHIFIVCMYHVNNSIFQELLVSSLCHINIFSGLTPIHALYAHEICTYQLYGSRRYAQVSNII